MATPAHHRRILMAVLACAVPLAVAGCDHAKVHAAAPVKTVPTPAPTETQRPMTVAPDTNASPPVVADAAPPAIPATTVAPPSVALPNPKPGPKPPKQAAGQPVEVADEPAHPAAPQISPKLSAGEQANYERNTNDDISVAKKNIQQANGKQLSAAQQDLYDKISSFLKQSGEASQVGDWARAQNLAQKARLLSVELANSL